LVASILVIDDEQRIAAFVSRALQAHGLATETACGGEDALSAVRSGRFALLVLDLMMPGVDGFALLRAARALERPPRVIVLSAMSDVATKVRCLELGASDFVAKPFALPELVARVRVRLREPGAGGAMPVLHAGGIVLDTERRTADAGAGPVSLTAREFALLAHLLRKGGEICSREELLESVWSYAHDPGTNVVDVCVRRLRAKLGHASIETVRHAGYRI
jgi:DNA-binding response OmpR family regulator